MLTKTCIDRKQVPWQFHLSQYAGKALPPVVSPLITSYLYPYSRARMIQQYIEAKSVAGLTASLPLADVHGYLFALNGYYDWRLLAIAQAVVSEGDLVVEVGANIGTESIGLAQTVGAAGRVLAFEPFSDNVRTLTKVLNSAGVLDRVEILAEAVGDEDGELDFIAPQEEGMTGVGYLLQGKSGGGSIRVKVTVAVLKRRPWGNTRLR